MSKIIGPIQFQGKLGTIVGRATRKGYMSLGMAPTKYTNPQTPKQVWARARFLAVQNFVSRVPRAAFAGLARSAQSGKMSLANMAFKYNTAIQNGHDAYHTEPMWQDPHVETDGSVIAVMGKSALKFSKGTNVLTATAINVDTPLHLKFTLLHAFETVSDNMLYHIIVFCPDTGEFLHFEQDGSDNNIDVTVPELWNGQKVCVYAYAQYWNDDVDFNYSIFGGIGGTASFLAENAKTEATQTLYLGEVTVG